MRNQAFAMYPVFLSLKNRLVVVIGGGTVGCRKAVRRCSLRRPEFAW